MPAACVKPVPKGVDAALASASEPLGIAVHALDLVGLAADESVAIIGGGPIGLSVLALARAKGAKVVGRVVKVKNKEMKVTLASVELHGKSYELETNSVAQSAKNQAKNNPKDSTQAKGKTDTKDVTTLPAQSQLSFKLAKSVTIPVKG